MTGETAPLSPETVGDRLRAARERQGLSLTEVAARTRIPLRHLEAIETGDYAALPSATYAVGFAKAYARAVGLDEVQIGREVRERDDATVSRREYETYEITDPKRVPGRGLAIVAAVIAVLVLIGGTLWLGSGLIGEGAPAPATSDTPAATAAAPPATAVAAPTSGPVRLTATGEVWLRVYDAAGTSLFEKTLQAGERYDVPPDAANPMINIGRPDKLQVTVNGVAVPALGDGSRPIKDVGISAAALAARSGPALAPVVAPTPAATTSASPRPSATRSPAARTSSRRTREPDRPTPAEEAAPLNIGAPADTPTPRPLITGKPTP